MTSTIQGKSTEEIMDKSQRGWNAMWRENIGPRDNIFSDILMMFNTEPINILQVGAIETLEPEWRIGSGWSDIFFGPYTKHTGGNLVICDIDLNHLAHSAFVARELNYEVMLLLERGENVILERTYDLYYLDGSNDPEDMKREIENILKIDGCKCIILCDDWSIKGTLSRDLCDWVELPEVANGMAYVDLR